MANESFTTATDFADYLVKEKKLTFRDSYAVAAKLVNYAEKKNKLLSELSLQEIMKIYKNLDKKVLKIFDVNNSMNSKRSHGGTAIANVKAMIKKMDIPTQLAIKQADIPHLSKMIEDLNQDDEKVIKKVKFI